MTGKIEEPVVPVFSNAHFELLVCTATAVLARVGVGVYSFVFTQPVFCRVRFKLAVCAALARKALPPRRERILRRCFPRACLSACLRSVPRRFFVMPCCHVCAPAPALASARAGDAGGCSARQRAWWEGAPDLFSRATPVPRSRTSTARCVFESCRPLSPAKCGLLDHATRRGLPSAEPRAQGPRSGHGSRRPS